MEDLEDNEVLHCAVCGETLDYINTAHLRMHGMTCGDYYEKFGLPMQSNSMRRAHSEDVQGIFQSVESTELRSISLRKYWASPEGEARRNNGNQVPI